MTLFEFIKAFVRPNTLLRLWVEIGGQAHYYLHDEETGSNVTMEWAILDGSSWASEYSNCNVIGVTDILCSEHPDAVNIVIDRRDFNVY